jgi:nitroimidazol reductase NimA-like FMN-containing flavoprotein (pyridoxamine 5'-phosphate oxidase superfamily)
MTSEPHRSGSISTIDEGECWQLVDTTTVGRLAFTTEDGIVILPVNFFVFDERIYVRTEPGSSIAALADGRDDVAFEVDYHDGMNQSGWNVLMKVTASAAEPAAAEKALASTGRLGPWPPGNRSLVIALTPRSIGGRRVAMH